MQDLFRSVLAFALLIFVQTNLHAQNATLRGRVTTIDHEPLLGASVYVSAEVGTATDSAGLFELNPTPGNINLTVSYLGYKTFTQSIGIVAGQTVEVDIILQEEATILNTVTFTTGRFEKRLGSETVSIEVLKPSLINNSNKFQLDEALQKVPGLTVIDGQANIRGGSGFSYGAGSRVLLLMDDIPILQLDAGFPNWNDIPIENVGQIEVVKGAASSLYGSAAMNGVVNFRTAYATAEPETKLTLFTSTVDAPADARFKWWDNAPLTFGTSFSHKQKLGKLDLVSSVFYLNETSHNDSTFTKYGRVNLNTRYRLSKRMTLGVNLNLNGGNNSSFFFWKADSLKYSPFPGTVSKNQPLRFNIDPHLTYYDGSGNRHKLLSRYLKVENRVSNGRSNFSEQYYLEYQFQRNIKAIDLNVTAGAVYIGSDVEAELYGDTTFHSRNLATYIDFEKRFGTKLTVSAGFRYESNLINNPGFTYPGGVVEPSKEKEAKPVLRLGANYQIGDYSFLRASWGQGYRFPTIAEKFIFTSLGGFNISPNPDLQSETGWSTELGIKQGLKLGSLKGFLDLALFRTEYQDMMEFNFLGLLRGFSSINTGGVRITGLDASMVGEFDLFGCPTVFTAGYLFIDPKFLDFDLSPQEPGVPPTPGQRNAIGSSSTENVLKYRSRHNYKFDIETQIKKLSIGFAGNYFSFQEAIDRTFEFIVPGIKSYREMNNHGVTLLDIRVAYRPIDNLKLSFLVNNLGNQEYVSRPGLMEAPRNFGLRVDWGW